MMESLNPRFLPDRDFSSEWGGKGANLVRLIRKGFRVPPTAAFGRSNIHRELMKIPGYEAAIEEWRRGRVGGERSLMRRTIEAIPMPADWERTILSVRQMLCGGEEWPLIFRSSANVEDQEGFSFAGCFDSVEAGSGDPSGAWDAFRKVVASGYRDGSAWRVLSSALDPRDFRMAVVVQPRLKAEISGVCFSRDPARPWDRNGRVEWVEGSGEKLVQGEIAPQSRRRAEGQPEGCHGIAMFWKELWIHAELAERCVGGPVDLEWVWDGESLWFVQARLIATEEARLVSRFPGRRWTRALTLERFPEALSPMGWSVLQDAFRVNLRTLEHRFGITAKRPEEVAVCVRGIVYSDPGYFSYPAGVKIKWSKYFAPWRWGSWRLLSSIVVSFLRWCGRRIVRVPRNVSDALLKLDLMKDLMLAEANQIEIGWERHRDRHLAELMEFEADRGADLLERMEKLRGLSSDFMEPDLAVYLIKDSIYRALLSLWRGLGGEEAKFPELVQSFSGNRTLEMNEEWIRLVNCLKDDPYGEEFCRELCEARGREWISEIERKLSPASREAWSAFISANGHLNTSWDVAIPCWGEEPQRLGSLLSVSRQSTWGSELVAPLDQVQVREVARKKLLEMLSVCCLSNRVIQQVFNWLGRLESFMRIDEEHHFLSGRLIVPSRRLLLLAAEVLVDRCQIEAAEDVFLLSLDEVKAALRGDEISFKARVFRRRSEWERSRLTQAPFEIPFEEREAKSALNAEGSLCQWKGLPMSPGVAEGLAIVAEHLHELKTVPPGAILVTTSPNPALTPLYPLLGGLVSATGGALSHGFVSAREYALPAVSGIPGVTRCIPQGARIRVDGASGTVQLLESLV